MALNILIVDDSDVIRAMIARTLRLAQVEVGTVREAANGQEALTILDTEWVDLVFADINMPVMNGVEMIERMRDCPETADIPVIVVSSEGATERVEALMHHGVTAWVRKPFTPEEIRDVVMTLTTEMVDTPEWFAQIDSVLGPVLETFAFAYLEPLPLEDLPETGDKLYCSSLSFSGATAGVLTILAPSELCAEFAASILGMDRDDPDARIAGADTLAEITNIAAGHLATAIEPSRATDLHPPVVTQVDAAEWLERSRWASARAYLVEEHPMLVTLQMRSLTAAR